MNVNGVCDWGNHKASVGCVLRNNDGEFYRGCGGMIGMFDPEFTGLWAIYYGLKFAWEKEKTKLVFETDAADLLKRVVNPDPADSCVYLIDMIVRLMDEDWESLQMSSIPPSVNGDASALADYCMDGERGMDEFKGPPQSVKEFVDQEKGK